MLQEVHCSENTADLWACEWGYKTLLVVVQAVKRESAFFLTTLLIYRSLRFFQTQTAVS